MDLSRTDLLTLGSRSTSTTTLTGHANRSLGTLSTSKTNNTRFTLKEKTEWLKTCCKKKTLYCLIHTNNRLPCCHQDQEHQKIHELRWVPGHQWHQQVQGYHARPTWKQKKVRRGSETNNVYVQCNNEAC